jgi:hypothetical protein
LFSPISKKCKVEDVPVEQVTVGSCHPKPQRYLDRQGGEHAVGSAKFMAMHGAVNLGNVCGPNGKYSMKYGRCHCKDGYLPTSDEHSKYAHPH